MNRFRMLAAAFALLTACLAYEAARAALNAMTALSGGPGHRLIIPGLMNLCVAVVTLIVAGLTFRLARMQLIIGRIRASARDRNA